MLVSHNVVGVLGFFGFDRLYCDYDLLRYLLWDNETSFPFIFR